MNRLPTPIAAPRGPRSDLYALLRVARRTGKFFPSAAWPDSLANHRRRLHAALARGQLPRCSRRSDPHLRAGRALVLAGTLRKTLDRAARTHRGRGESAGSGRQHARAVYQRIHNFAADRLGDGPPAGAFLGGDAAKCSAWSPLWIFLLVGFRGADELRDGNLFGQAEAALAHRLDVQPRLVRARGNRSRSVEIAQLFAIQRRNTMSQYFRLRFVSIVAAAVAVAGVSGLSAQVAPP